MKKYLITGFSGFVARHFLELLEREKTECYVLGVDVNEPPFSFSQYAHVDCRFLKIDLLDVDKVKAMLNEFRPDYILHLASFSSVAYSWKEPVVSTISNLTIFLNLADQIRLLEFPCRVLSVGSSEEYGRVSQEALPLMEKMETHPVSPYAVTRLAQEQLSKVYSFGYGLDIVMTRSFNHIGPGQRDTFAIPSFVKKILEARQTGIDSIKVGNVDLVRDFVDVRDVVRAYLLLLQNGEKGEIYNICSGNGIPLREVIHMIMEELNWQVRLITDDDLIRPVDNEVIFGSYKKLNSLLGWRPEIKIRDSLRDIIADWCSR